MKSEFAPIVESVVLGAAVGDAFGVPFEFLDASSVQKFPLDRMYGANIEPQIPSHWGSSIPSGVWSDDTAMALATMQSFVHKNG